MQVLARLEAEAKTLRAKIALARVHAGARDVLRGKKVAQVKVEKRKAG